MAKRFTDKNKWEDDWYASLDNDCKIVWEYLLDHCDHAGIGKINFRLLNFCCNVMWDLAKLKEIFDSRLKFKSNFYFIPNYLKFQYPKGLNSNKPAIRSVRNILIEKDLYNFISKLYGNGYLMIKESLDNCSITVKDKDIYKDKDKDKDKDIPRKKPEGIDSFFTTDKYTLQQFTDKAVLAGLSDDEATEAYHHFKAQGFNRGNGQPLLDIESGLVIWARNRHKFTSKTEPGDNQRKKQVRERSERIMKNAGNTG